MQLGRGRMYDVQHLLKKKAYCLNNVNTLYLKQIFLDIVCTAEVIAGFVWNTYCIL